MWWLIPIGVGAYIIKKSSEKNKKKNVPSQTITILEQNLFRLRKILTDDHSKKNLLLGQPGSGKSSLLLSITNECCQPEPSVGPTTDQTDWSKDNKVNLIHTYKSSIYVDLPGYDTENHNTNTMISNLPLELFDTIIMVISGKIHESDQKMWNAIRNRAPFKKILIVRTYSDSLDDDSRQEVMVDLFNIFKKEPIFISNRSNEGIEKLITEIGI